MSRFGRTENIIFTTAFLSLLAFSYFLYDDSLLFPSSNTLNLQQIGDVALSQNDVRRKNVTTFSWLPASKKDMVYQNDSIFTGDRSEAIVRLQDGTQIKLQPNSLITLNINNGQMNLDLRYGNLIGELAQGSSLTIKSGSEEFKLESQKGSKEKSSIEFNKSHSGNVDLKLLSGDLKLIDTKKKAVKDLTKDAAFAVTKNGEVKQVAKPEITLLTADNTQWTRINPDDPLPFEWQGKGEISNYELEISAHSDFNNVLVSKKTSESRALVSDPLEPGAYYWRLKALTPNGQVGATSEPRQIVISHLQGPQITNPAPSAQIQLEIKLKGKEAPEASTEIRWQSTSALKQFKWQIASDESFQAILKEGQTTELAALTPKLPSGNYWVRVQGQTSEQKDSPWSAAVPFSLSLLAKKEERPDRPILLTKSIKFQAPTGKDRNPASPQAPEMAWKPVLKSKKYILQISRDASFKESQKYEVTNNSSVWTEYRPGSYFYRVFARGANGLVSEPSETGTIEVSIGDLTLNPFKAVQYIGRQAKPQEIPISWNEVPFAKSYLVEMDKSKDFAQPRQLEYTANSSRVTLPDPGLYHIRVQARDADNKPLTGFSNIEDVLYTFRRPLNKPALMEPFNAASIFLQTEMEPFIWLEWKKVEGASKYRIEISDKPDFSRTLIAKSLQGNRYLIKERVPLGKIYWRVRAEAKESSEISEWTEKREFTLYHQKNETFAK